MMKLAGSLCIMVGGAFVWWFRMSERRRRRNALRDLMTALRRMGEEIRMTRRPLPGLLEALAADCRTEAAALFRAAANAARRGEGLAETWRRETEALPLGPRDREILRKLDFHGDEESVYKGISLVIYQLEKSIEELERTGLEEAKRTTALCFSGAALLVILLL